MGTQITQVHRDHTQTQTQKHTDTHRHTQIHTMGTQRLHKDDKRNTYHTNTDRERDTHTQTKTNTQHTETQTHRDTPDRIQILVRYITITHRILSDIIIILDTTHIIIILCRRFCSFLYFYRYVVVNSIVDGRPIAVVPYRLHAHTHTHTHTDRETDIHRHTHTDTHRHRHTQTDTHKTRRYIE